jgi:low affinity Fe/Cu permease
MHRECSRERARLALAASEAVGTPHAFLLALFLMVLLIQATQNGETRALHLKLGELIRSQRRARNIFADLEHATDEELAELEAEFRKIRARAEARRHETDASRAGPR